MEMARGIFGHFWSFFGYKNGQFLVKNRVFEVRIPKLKAKIVIF